MPRAVAATAAAVERVELLMTEATEVRVRVRGGGTGVVDVNADPVFVVSTGRCGSTLVSGMLREHPAVLSLSEFFVHLIPEGLRAGEYTGAEFWDVLTRPRRRWTFLFQQRLEVTETLYRPGNGARFTADSGVPPILMVTLPHLTEKHEQLYDELAGWVPDEPRRTLRGHYDALFAWLCARFGRDRWIERSGSSSGWIHETLAAYPKARFVHLFRDGRDTALSMSRHAGFKFALVSRRLAGRLGADPYNDGQKPAVRPPRALLPYLPETFDRRRFVDLDVPLEEYGRNWSRTVVQSLDVLDRLGPDRALHVSYENLVCEPAGQLRRIAAFAGVDAGDGWLERAGAMARPAPSRWQQLPGEQRDRLAAACRPGMDALRGRD